MLAQNFLSYRKLRIPKKEHEALVKLLGMLEREELSWHRPDSENYDLPSTSGNFNMVAYEQHCGTVCCMAGWADKLFHTKFVDGNDFDPWGRWNNDELDDLFCMMGFDDEEMEEVKPHQAAMALRNYLTRGDADWPGVLGKPQFTISVEEIKSC